MQIIEIVVSAGRTFNHPYESFSNLRPSVTLKASLSENDNPDEAVRELQVRAEKLVEEHKQDMLIKIENDFKIVQESSIARESSADDSEIPF